MFQTLHLMFARSDFPPRVTYTDFAARSSIREERGIPQRSKWSISWWKDRRW